MHAGDSDQSRASFGDSERLLLHQLRLLEWQDAHAGERSEPDSKPVVDAATVPIPEKWFLTKGVNLYDWQKQCISQWFDGGCRGTVKVVTGGGKTLLALAIAERLQKEKEPDLCLAIVVPTIVLMHQWYDELLEKGNLPAESIARLGGGYQEKFSERKRVLISVLASAHNKLAGIVRDSGVAKKLLMVADECHRTGGAKMSNVFKTVRTYNLGLSATPESDEDSKQGGDDGYNESLPGQELGPIIYNFTLNDALNLGVVPPYSILHYGLSLSSQEQQRYSSISRKISEARQRLQNQAPAGRKSGDAFFRWIRSVAGNTGETSDLASRLMADTSRRKALLYAMEGRGNAVETLLRREFDVNPDARVILFHESIIEVMKLFMRLREARFPVIAEHSKLPDSLREAGLELFRKGVAQVIMSAKSLIEGFNVPAIDMAIIVASSGSVRQRVQSLGRVLRKHRGRSGEEKVSIIHVLYARDTVDDAIYGKFNWEQITGIERNLYYHWDGLEEPVSQQGPPQIPLPAEGQIDDTILKEGEEYPGKYEGAEYSCDNTGNIQDMNGVYVRNPGNLPELVIETKGSAGRFRITEQRKYVLARVKREGEWITIFITRQEGEFDLGENEKAEEVHENNVREWAENASPGDEYPYLNIDIIDEGLRYRNRRGGVIAKRIRGGEVFARTSERADDYLKGVDAESTVKAVRELNSGNTNISRIEINALNHVVYRANGSLFFVCSLRQGLEFPNLET